MAYPTEELAQTDRWETEHRNEWQADYDAKVLSHRAQFEETDDVPADIAAEFDDWE